MNALAVLGSNVFAGTYGSGVFRTTNNGNNWTAVNNGITYNGIYSLVVSDGNIFAGTTFGVFISTNAGNSWTLINSGLYYTTSFSLAASGSTVMVGTEGGVYVSTNNGTQWIARNEGFSFTPMVYSLLIANNYVFAGTLEQSVWRRSFNEIIIDVNKTSKNIPSEYSLGQNYPNPFNPATKIKFDIPNSENGKWKTENGLVTLKVYSITGKEVTILVNEKLNGGSYEATFNASQYPSGVYFYRLQVGDYNKSKKMILLK